MSPRGRRRPESGTLPGRPLLPSDPGLSRRARRAPSPPPGVPARAPLGPGIIASRVGFPDLGFLIGLGGSLCSSLGIKLNIWTLSPHPLFFFLGRSLRQNQEADDPYLLVGWKKGGKPKVPAPQRSLGASLFFSCVPRAPSPAKGGSGEPQPPKEARLALEERSPDYPSPGQSGGAFLPTLLGATATPLRSRLF